MRYSVIIPAYNAAKTIERCLDSILLQLPEDGEIVIIDDGSVDETFCICNNYSSKDPRIVVCKVSNGGVSSARNRGLAIARGSFILFVDSDDAIKPGFFDLVRKYTNSDPDFVLFHHDHDFLKGQTECLTSRVDDTRRVLCVALRRQLLNSPCARVFRRDLIERNALRFDERLEIGEDKVFVVQYSFFVENAAFVNADIYQAFTDNSESLSRKKRAALVDSIILEHSLLFDASEKTGDNALVEAVTYSYYRSAYTVIYELQKFELKRRMRIKTTKMICRKYHEEKRTRIASAKDLLVAVPVLLNMASGIDLMLSTKNKSDRKKHKQ